MKKRTGKLALALAALAMLVTTIGCKDPNNGIKTVEEETKSYTVTFNTNGGSAIEAVSVDEGNTLTLPDDPTKTGYDFKGWFTDDALSAEFDATVAITEDTTLYAKWAATSYTITYVLNDEKATNAAANPATYTIESEDITLADPTTENTEKPHFAGWYSDETCETAATGITKGSTGNKTFYAKWSDKFQYTVTFYNGETSLGTAKVTEGEKLTIPSTIAVEGYTIEGWYTDSALTKAFDADTIISADTPLYAKLIAKVTVKFMNGTTEVDSKTIDSGTKVTAPAALTKTGYTFGGWKAGDVTLAAGATSAAISADTTFTAVWTAITYTIKFDANGGSGEVSSITATYDQDVTLPENAFTYAIFTNWNTSADGSGTEYASGASVKNLASTAGAEVTLYAQWDCTLWSGSVIFGNWENGVSVSAEKFSALLASGVALKISYTYDDSFTDDDAYCQFGFTVAGDASNSKYSGVDMTANEYGCIDVSKEASTLYFPLSDSDVATLKTNGLYLGGHAVIVTKVEVKTYERVTISSEKTYTCVGAKEDVNPPVTTATVTTYATENLDQPFELTNILKIVDSESYTNSGVIFDFSVPVGKTFADYTVSGLFYFPRAGNDSSLYYKDINLYADSSLTENTWNSAKASVSTAWNSHNAWLAFAPSTDDTSSLETLTGDIQFAIGMNSDSGTYYLAELFIYEN